MHAIHSSALDMLGYKNLHNDRAFVPFLFPDGEYSFSGERMTHCAVST